METFFCSPYMNIFYTKIVYLQGNWNVLTEVWLTRFHEYYLYAGNENFFEAIPLVVQDYCQISPETMNKSHRKTLENNF